MSIHRLKAVGGSAFAFAVAVSLVVVLTQGRESIPVAAPVLESDETLQPVSMPSVLQHAAPIDRSERISTAIAEPSAVLEHDEWSQFQGAIIEVRPARPDDRLLESVALRTRTC